MKEVKISIGSIIIIIVTIISIIAIGVFSFYIQNKKKDSIEVQQEEAKVVQELYYITAKINKNNEITITLDKQKYKEYSGIEDIEKEFPNGFFEKTYQIDRINNAKDIYLVQDSDIYLLMLLENGEVAAINLTEAFEYNGNLSNIIYVRNLIMIKEFQKVQEQGKLIIYGIDNNNEKHEIEIEEINKDAFYLSSIKTKEVKKVEDLLNTIMYSNNTFMNINEITYENLYILIYRAIMNGKIPNFEMPDNEIERVEYMQRSLPQVTKELFAEQQARNMINDIDFFPIVQGMDLNSNRYVVIQNIVGGNADIMVEFELKESIDDRIESLGSYRAELMKSNTIFGYVVRTINVL